MQSGVLVKREYAFIWEGIKEDDNGRQDEGQKDTKGEHLKRGNLKKDGTMR